MWDYAQDTVEALRRQQAGVLGRVTGTLSQVGRAGARLFGLTGKPDFPALPPEPETPQHGCWTSRRKMTTTALERMDAYGTQ